MVETGTLWGWSHVLSKPGKPFPTTGQMHAIEYPSRCLRHFRPSKLLVFFLTFHCGFVFLNNSPSLSFHHGLHSQIQRKLCVCDTFCHLLAVNILMVILTVCASTSLPVKGRH